MKPLPNTTPTIKGAISLTSFDPAKGSPGRMVKILENVEVGGKRIAVASKGVITMKTLVRKVD